MLLHTTETGMNSSCGKPARSCGFCLYSQEHLQFAWPLPVGDGHRQAQLPTSDGFFPILDSSGEIQNSFQQGELKKN